MRIIQISDLHICAKDDDSAGAVSMAANLAKCTDHINQLSTQPDLVLITGNITNDGSIEAAEHARELLDRLDCPYKLVPGPNDDRRVTLSVFENSCANEVGGVVSYIVNGLPMRLIGLDSLGHNGTGGFICQKRLNWLNDNLSQDTTTPTMIFMHHPPMNPGVAGAGYDGFNNSEYLGQVVSHYPNIKAIICGHINFASHTCWNRTVVSSAPGMGMQSALELAGNGEATGRPGYNIHHLTGSADLISRTVYLS